MLDESLLDASSALTRADTDGLLRGAAQAGARVRTAVRQAEEAGLADLRVDGRPRGILVAGPPPTAGSLADLLAALGSGGVPVSVVRTTGPRPEPDALRWSLPGWAGSFDLLLLATADGTEPGLADLAELAYRRGCTTAAVAPAGSPLAETVTRRHGLVLPPADPPHPHPAGPGDTAAPGALWALLAPLLGLADRLRLVTAPPAALRGLADHLDQVAERCGPVHATYGNPAKTLATELDGTLPLLWTEGRIAAAVGRHAATTLTTHTGRPALAAELPEALRLHQGLLTGTLAAGADPQDLFRDRVEEPPALRARLVLLCTHTPEGESAVPAARETALAAGVPTSEPRPERHEDPLRDAAELLATMDYAAAYLALAGAGH